MNSDLEMAAVLLQYLVLHKEVEIQFARSGVLSDNTPTEAWLACIPDKEQSHTPVHLLRVLAAVQRTLQSGPLNVAFISGVEKSMSGVASRRFG